MASERIIILDPNTKPSDSNNKESISPHISDNPFLGTSATVRQLENNALKLVNANGPVLIQGEPGTGKGVLARWLHESGPHDDELQVDLQCMGVPGLRLEAKLFGYEKGVFGARQGKPGLLEIAQSGSVFIDEIGDFELDLQKKILRLLGENKFRRLGETQDRQSAARVTAATRRNITKRVQENRFLRDLYHLFGEPLVVPPLRERVEDIPLLAGYLLERVAEEHQIGAIHLSPVALQSLQSFSWPGNVRELRNTLERAVLLSGSQHLSEDHLQFSMTVAAGYLQMSSLKTLEEVEREYIKSVLSLEGGKVQSAAKKLGIPRSSLYHKLKQFGIGRRAANPAQWNRSTTGPNP